MIVVATTVAASAVAVTGAVVVGWRSTRSRELLERRRYSDEEIHLATELGYATCRFNGARSRRRLHLSVIGDVLIFRDGGPSAELVELLPLRRMQASGKGNTIDIEACSQKVSLQLNERQEKKNVMRELEAAKRFSDTAAAIMARRKERDEGETCFCINEERLSKEARDYLAKHSPVVERLSQAFNAMLRDRPPFPDTFLAEGLLTKTEARGDLVEQLSHDFEGLLTKTEVPFLHAGTASPHVAKTVEPPKAIQIDDAESDGESENGQMRRSSLEKWDGMNWSHASNNKPYFQAEANSSARGKEVEVDSPKMAFLRLRINSPTWRKELPPGVSPSRSRDCLRDLRSPSRNIDSPSRCRSAASPAYAFDNGWKAAS